MIHRRRFLQSSLIAGISGMTLTRSRNSAAEARAPTGTQPLQYDVRRDIPTRLFDGKRCRIHPRAGIVAGKAQGSSPRVVMTLNSWDDLGGGDIFKEMDGLYTDNLGASWTEPVRQEGLSMRKEIIDGQERLVVVSDYWPKWHAASRTLLGTGHTVVYTSNWHVAPARPRHTVYATYDPAQNAWAAWRKMEMPSGGKFFDAGAGSTQRFDLEDGTILLPFYFRPPPGKNSLVAVARCAFDGKELRYIEHGDELQVNDGTRGLHEPSLARFGGKFYLTIRNDRRGFVAESADGLHFEPIREWKFDDGSELGNHNTQQHWVTHRDGLFLVYTRRGANNDHVFRHRAPLFMAQVDPERLCVLRNTEQILMPERGARLGNFGVTDVSPDETWVTDAEGMQPSTAQKHGSDGSVFVARIHWRTPNLPS